MKILVTGGAGYIGSHTVVELYNSGHEAVIIDNFSNSTEIALQGLKKILKKDIPFYEKDCLDIESIREVFEQHKIDGVIHYAALKAVGESKERPLDYYENNILGLINILRLMDEYNVNNLIFSSSACVYGVPEELPVTEETSRADTESPYGNTKKISEDIISDVAKVSNLKAVMLRYFNPIGAHPSGLIGELPMGKPNNLVPYITQSAAGIRGPLTIFGNNFDTPDGYQVRDFIHIMDLAGAHVKALDYLEKQETGFSNIFNLGTGKGVSVMELINAFQKVSDGSLEYTIGEPRMGDIDKIWADATKAEKILGWKAELTLEDALRDAWNWQLELQKQQVDK